MQANINHYKWLWESSEVANYILQLQGLLFQVFQQMMMLSLPLERYTSTLTRLASSSVFTLKLI